ncbi:MAG TPA: hypothetical protein VFW00_14510 [Rhodocyclaceae bacterium]|nr:hypothetical protein [Rhodocyclaceae bacterium]
MKNNIIMLAFASILATTAADWAIDAKVTGVRGNASRANKENPNQQRRAERSRSIAHDMGIEDRQSRGS